LKDFGECQHPEYSPYSDASIRYNYRDIHTFRRDDLSGEKYIYWDVAGL